MTTRRRDETVSFFSSGLRLTGTLHLPDAPNPPVIVHGPGWLETRCAQISETYHDGFVTAGFAVLNFDARGFGDSEGERGWLLPFQQIEDILSAVAYVRTREDLAPHRIGLYGVGGTGGGNALYAAAADSRILCTVAQTVVTDGREWLRFMRREYEWVEFLARVERNRMRRVLDNSDELVNPREEIMIATPERRTSGVRKDDDVKVGGDFHLSSVESLLRYRPIDVIDRIAPRALLLTCVVGDDVTPEAHAVDMYTRAGSPKKLVRQLGVRHYESYGVNRPILLEQFTDWYRRYLVVDVPRAEIHSSEADVEVVVRPARDGADRPVAS
jgi:dipeptidyl aminopeptidase/acylaminoacyl peptidase